MYHANFDINLPPGVAKLLGGVSEWSPTNDHDAFGSRQDSRVSIYRSLNNTCVCLFNHFHHSRDTGCGGGRTIEQDSKSSVLFYPPNHDIPQKCFPEINTVSVHRKYSMQVKYCFSYISRKNYIMRLKPICISVIRCFIMVLLRVREILKKNLTRLPRLSSMTLCRPISCKN